MGPGFESLEVHHLFSSIAQSVERMTVNHDVTGSSPVRGAIKSRVSGFFYFPERGVGSNQSDIRVTVIVYFVNQLLICRAGLKFDEIDLSYEV